VLNSNLRRNPHAFSPSSRRRLFSSSLVFFKKAIIDIVSIHIPRENEGELFGSPSFSGVVFDGYQGGKARLDGGRALMAVV
jgi:hypothetical protein